MYGVHLAVYASISTTLMLRLRVERSFIAVLVVTYFVILFMYSSKEREASWFDRTIRVVNSYFLNCTSLNYLNSCDTWPC